MGGLVRYRLKPPKDIRMRIPSEYMLNSVLFIGTKDGFDWKYRGTCCVVAVREGGRTFGYVVTAKHVADNLHPEYAIRATSVEGKAIVIECEEEEWTSHPSDSNSELAVARFGFGTVKTGKPDQLAIAPIR